jgi:hypothetical protein
MGNSCINSNIMGKTFKHTFNAKFKQRLISIKDIPEYVYNMWNRHNNDWGELRAKKKQITEKIIDKLNKKL